MPDAAVDLKLNALAFGAYARALLLTGLVVALAISCGCDARPPDTPASQDTPASTTAPPAAKPADAAKPAADAAKPADAPTTLDRAALMTRADNQLQAQDWPAAAATLRQILVAAPDDAEALFKLAQTQAASDQMAAAIESLDLIPRDHPQAGLAALGQSADWSLALHRYDDAMQRYRKVLQHVPDAAIAHRQLAYLLNRQGRRQEAAVHLRRLCQLGDVRQDELHGLIMIKNAIADDPDDAADRQRPYYPIGPGGRARVLWSEGKFLQAAETLEPSINSGTAPAALVALYGRAAVESQDDARLAKWLAIRTPDSDQFADSWAAIGAYLVSQRRFPEATRALIEAIDRDPTDITSMGRLQQTLAILGNDELAQAWSDRWFAVNDTNQLNNEIAATEIPDPAAISKLVDKLNQLGRPLESLLWQTIGGLYHGADQADLQQWNQQRQQLVAAGDGFPDQRQRLCGMQPGDYPLPQLQPSDLPSASQSLPPSIASLPTASDPAPPARLTNIAAAIGLQHTYHVASEPQQQRFAIYQTLGGGVAVLDYDLDGHPDLYFAQGGADPPSFRGRQTNQLLRQRSARLDDVTAASNSGESQYTIGVTAGDWNQDGFADLVVANIGSDALLINNGDGSFTSHTITAPINRNRVPSSTAMADISGDGLPDLYQVGYVDDATILVRPPVNDSDQVLQTVSPNNFDPSPDWWIENDAVGGLDARPWTTQPRQLARGLGVVITDLDDQTGNEIFVGNDLQPNQLWTRPAADQPAVDVAELLGCAYGFTGLATGSMGIASGDFDRNGTIDIHITNYENQNASLFLRRQDAYQDRNIQFRLDEPTKLLVGFGTQAIDQDNDGRLDLVVTNGHLEDSLANPMPLRQPAQLFHNQGDHFRTSAVTDDSGYWSTPHVGRALARLDFDRDGRMDFVITHISEPSALIRNETATPHHWLQLQLVGVGSERDAIGASVRIRHGDHQATEVVTAGDGYLSRNEPLVAFGLGDAREIDSIEIRWPSGTQQEFRNLAADARYLIIENQPQPFRQ